MRIISSCPPRSRSFAEIDLELRGEGELVGVRQSGLAHFRVAELPRDAELQERAKKAGIHRLVDTFVTSS